MAGGIPEATIEEIKARVDLADLVSSYGIAVRRAGGSYTACCPFHNEKTPSFHIRPESGRYHCFGCGAAGDAITFVERQEGLTFMEAVRKLAARCGVTLEEKEDPEAFLRKRLLHVHAEFATACRRYLLKAKEGARARAYLKDRRLEGEIAERFQIGYAPAASSAILSWAAKNKISTDDLQAAGILLPPKFSGGTWYNRFGGRVVFPIRDKAGRTVAFSCRTLETDKAKIRAKYVNSPETCLFKKSNVLYAFDLAARHIVNAPRREALVCEGQIDVIRCHACGFETAVASQGTAFTEEHVRMLKKCADSVILVFDADGAGEKAAIRTGGLFLAAEMPVRVAALPAGEDPDSLLLTQGAEAFENLLGAAESITAFQVRALRRKERNPASIDAMTRVSRAVLETIAQCPSAMMRATLLTEAAEKLGLPVRALEEDLEKALRAGNRPAKHPAERIRRPAPSVAPGGDAAKNPEDAAEDIPAELDAAAPENVPPPPRETALCAFLFAHEQADDLAALVASSAPPELFAHDYTRAFVNAWLLEKTSGRDEIAALRENLPPAGTRWLDGILLATDLSGLSELEPAKILQDLLRTLWQAAVKRLQGSLDASSTAENDRRRLSYSMLARKFQKSPWTALAPLMVASTLKPAETPSAQLEGQ